MSDLDPLYEVNPYTGTSPADQLTPMGDSTGATEENYSRVYTDDDYERVAPGTMFVDPEGNKRRKPLPSIKSDKDFDALPEGARFLDPEGNERQKPVYEPLSYTAQSLYSMAVTPKEKKKALEKFYPGKVREVSEGEFVVDDDGVTRAPGRWGSFGSAAGMVGGNLAPIAGGVIGGVVGAPLGGLPAAGSAALGTLGGQYFNDIILRLNGVYDRTGEEEIKDKAIGAGLSIAGDVVGRGVAAAVPSVKHGVSKITNALPDLANKFLGTNADDVTRARSIAELGEKPSDSALLRSFGVTGTDTGVGISTIAKESPHLQNVHEVFAPGFDTSRSLERSAETAYNKMAQPLLEAQGVQGIDDLVAPSAAVSTKDTGERLIRKALEDAGAIDARFAEELATRKAALEAGVPETTAQREILLKTAKEQEENASKLIRGAIDDIDRNADAAVRAAARGENSGDLWQAVAEQLRATRSALGQRFRRNAEQAYESVPGNARVRTNPIVDVAEDFVGQMPPEFEARNPSLVRRIRNLGRRPNPEFDPALGGGDEFLPAPAMSLAELHTLRSDLRAAADWYDLPSDFKNGALKYFSYQVDNLIQNVGFEGSPFETAVRLLNENDRWFAGERAIFNAKEIDTVIKGLKAGEPADPETLFKALVKPGNAEMIERLQQVVGPNLWSGVRAAQKQRWLQNARSGQFDQSVDAGAFAREILDAANDKTLFAVQGREEGQRMLTLAQQIGALDGKLPIDFRPNDTAFDIFRKARAAMDAADSAANKDPLLQLTRDVRKLEGQSRQARAKMERSDPLRFLTDKSYGASRAVDKILSDEDLILTAARRFGENSPEFNGLRQVWTERIFRGTLEPGQRLAKVTPEVQRLMLGVNLETAQKIAEDMSFIMSSKVMQRGDTAGGMALMSKVEHPVAGKTMSRAARIVPGLNSGARAALGAYYKFMSRVLESPATLRWLEKSYTDPAKREVIRQELSRIVQRGGAIGSGALQGAYQFGND